MANLCWSNANYNITETYLWYFVILLIKNKVNSCLDVADYADIECTRYLDCESASHGERRSRVCRFSFLLEEVTVFSNVFQAFDCSIRKDEHLAVAFFQRGITFYKMKRQDTPIISKNDLKILYLLEKCNP